MSSARHPLPTDIVALVSFDGRVYPNEANPFDRLGLEPKTRPLERALEQWFSFATGKQAWVSVRGATIRGLISARKRAKRSAWEIEVLIDASDDESVILSLFSRMTAGVIKQGAERVFLRVNADSDARDPARAAGFFSYCGEVLYRRGPEKWQPTGGDLEFRSRSKADTFGLFQLYNRVAPATVRAIEGLTLREWQAAQEKWGGRTHDMIVEEDGVITGWVRTLSGSPSRIYVLAERGPYDPLLGAGLDVLQDQEAFCLAPDYNPELASALERYGFEPVAQYESLAKRLTQPVEQAIPETSSEVVPAG
ncbi:MAG: hypothetical protein ABI559_06100 [Chloroflexota bacterium]